MIALSIGLLVLGAVAILMPGVALAVFTAMLGWLVLIGGILQIVQAFQAGALGGKWLGLGVGAFYAIAGLYIVINPVKSAAVFALALGLLFIAEGIFTIIMAFGYRVGRSMSWFVAINGIFTLILGILVINGWPMRSLWLIGLYVGISLLFSGASLLGAALAVRKEIA
ncbi:MAG: HdeD family acid-resistance protein [Leptolyngbya sp. DLM2.Bin27]|nr:MAG: HdeD family acid-resistance protein [Leptolyngbya sp. DLM2.Bin27]